MSTQHNDLLSLNSLMPIFEEYLTDLSDQWQEYQDGTVNVISTDMAQNYHQLSGAMTMVNLSLFANLSSALSLLSLRIRSYSVKDDDSDHANIKDLVAIAYTSHYLLQVELEKYFSSGYFHQFLLISSINNISSLLADNKLVIDLNNIHVYIDHNESLVKSIELPEDAKAHIALTDAQQSKIEEAWTHHTQRLIAQHSDSQQSIKQLHKMSSFIWRSCEDSLLQGLWYLSYLWLGCLEINTPTDPSKYTKLLNQLTDVLLKMFKSDSFDTLADTDIPAYELLAAELYVQLNLIEHTDEITQQAIKTLQGTYLKRYEFFNNILQSLVQNLVELPAAENFEKSLESLTKVKQRLARRGWAIYVVYLDLILADIDKLQHVDADDENELRWQVEKQIQDLYAAIFKMRQGITIDGSKIKPQDIEITTKKSECPLLRDIRIDVEKLKKHFKNYTETRDLNSLPTEDFFDNIRANLLELKLSKVVFVLGQMVALINRFHKNQLNQVSWIVLGATVDSISEFELFFDYMAQEMLDSERLKLVSERINQAEDLINYFLESNEAILPITDEPAIDITVTRYGDGGEIQPEDEGSAEEQVTSVETSKASVKKDNSALELARQNLKEDNFDMDEDIREIFEEEVAEVLETLDEIYIIWKNDTKNFEPLTDIRRSFHTLKGSGRMVGANNLGEMAWSIESLLNRVLDKTVEITKDLVDLIADVRGHIPILLNDFVNKQKPSIEPATTIAQANNLLKGVYINEGISLPTEGATDHTASSTLAETNEDVQDDTIARAKPEQSEQTDPNVQKSSEITVPAILQPFLDEAEALPADTTEMDEEIREIFIEEAEEVLEVILPTFAKWHQDTDNLDMLTDIRRGFHTLKGSGRMVGAHVTGELAWSIEKMLNLVLDKTIKIETGILLLINDVLQTYPELVEIFKAKSTKYPHVLPFWVACAHAYSDNLAREFDYARLVPLYINEEHRSAIEPLKIVLEDDVQGVPERSQVLTAILNTNNKLSNGLPIQRDQCVEDEPELFAIFISEAQDHLVSVKEFVESNLNEADVSVDDAIVRSFHTLRGASSFSSLQIISESSKTIEENLVYLQHHEKDLNQEQLKALSNSVSLMARQLDIDEAIIGPHDVDALTVTEETIPVTIVRDSLNIQEIITGIDELLDSEHDLESHFQGNEDSIVDYIELLISQITLLKSRTTESKSFQNLLEPIGQVYQKLIAHPEWINDRNIIDALNLANEQLIQLFDSLAGSMSLKVDEEVLETLNVVLTHLDHTEQKPSIIVETSAVANLDLEEIETDKELLDIFLEESHELEMDITQSFSEWLADPNDLNPLKELQRHLHTIKGGARMAGISSIGDLTHEMETVYEKFVNQELTPSVAWLEVMQRAQDVLSTQIEYIEENHRCFFTKDLITQLHTFIDLQEPPADVNLMIPVADAETPQQVVENNQNQLDIDDPEKKKKKEEDIGVTFDKLKLDSWGGTLPDIDILNVFLEEAEELMESTSLHLQSFKDDTSDMLSLQELQRELHTIKGGARMIGSDSIADLSHEMETVYEGLGNHHLPVNQKIIELLINSHDWLASSVQVLSHSINPPIPIQLIESLQQYHYSPESLADIPLISLYEYQEAIATYEDYRSQLQVVHDISSMPVMEGDFGEFKEITDLNSEAIRVPATVMEQMINLSGESVINRARVDMGISGLTNNIEEMGTTVHRLADQLRRMDTELEEQVLSQIDDDNLLESENFDPLEMDQYSSLNQLSKALSESASDLVDIKATLLERVRDSENLLLQLSRTQAELQDSLMNSRMVPFSRLTPRLQRIVRQTANEVNKQVELIVINADDEMDRSILERITSPLEHMLRNAVDHGIENREDRSNAGKPDVGNVTLSVSREGSELVIQLSDDGYGIDVRSVRQKAIKQGLIDPNDESLTDADIMQYIFNAGLSTTKKVTQISGRGVGMDVVRSEIRQLGGAVSVESVKGEGSRFVMRVPLTVAVSDALVVRAADTHYVIPLVQIERVEQVNPDELFAYYQSDNNTFNISDVDYRLRYLNEILTGNTVNDLAVSGNSTLPVIIIKNQTGQSLALQVDEIVGSRMEVVVKPLGKQLSHVSGVSAATIMGDGSIMLILDLIALIRNAPLRKVSSIEQQPLMDERKKVLVIDDSVTVRKVTSRFLEREGFEAHVAKDGVDALKILQEFTPDLMLLDIEMPRMDGFEVATQIRHNDRLKDIPIIMITSRTGDKHRERAMEIGVNDYLGKPFQELILLKSISNLLGLEYVFDEDEDE